MPTDLLRYTKMLAHALGGRPVGSCATASVALWHLWHAVKGERLILCIAFEDDVAHHVFLRRERILVDPTGHQFDSHRAHCYEPESMAHRLRHHRHTVETSDMQEFHDLLQAVGWPGHQWPTPTQVLTMTQRLLDLDLARAPDVPAQD